MRSNGRTFATAQGIGHELAAGANVKIVKSAFAGYGLLVTFPGGRTVLYTTTTRGGATALLHLAEQERDVLLRAMGRS